jgi:SAM-dependent methyltransferase
MEDKQAYIFDNYAENYFEPLNKSLRISGESADFFALERIKWMKQKIDRFCPGYNINSVLDFGCGTGDTLPIIENIFHPKQLTGIDLSVKNVEVANRNNQSSTISYYTTEKEPERLNFDMAYCSGVFHHIPKEERDNAVKTVYNSLSNNGIWAFWENNPWNPGTRYIMRKCPFDIDAIPLSFLESKQLLIKNGFNIIDISFCFVFPNRLKFLRFSEKALSSLPVGAQYLILARKV